MFNLSDMFNWRQRNTVVEENPQWLKPLEGDTQLLSSSQLNFITDVISRIKHQTQTITSTSETRIFELRQNVDSMKNKFQLMVEKLQTNSRSRECFIENYPQWRVFRDRNVLHLMKVADTIDTHRENCQISKVIGSLASIIGGGICLAAGDDENRKTSRMVGSAMMGLGTLTSAGTSAVEEILLRENIDKAKKIMQLEQECMTHLIEWLDDANFLQTAMDDIKSIGYNEDLMTVAENFQNVSQKNLSPRQKEKEIQLILNSLNVPERLREEISDIVGILMSACMLFDRYYPVFRLALKGHNVVSQLRLSADLFRAAYVGMNTVATFNHRGQMTKHQKNQVAGGMILDAFNIFSVYVSSQDPNSMESREIRKIANELKREAVQFKNLYEEIKSLDYVEDYRYS